LAADALRVERLSFDYGRGRGVEGVSFRVGPGETVGLVGPDGSGKSTVARLVLGLLRPSSGEVDVLESEGARADGGTGRPLAARVGACLSPAAFHERWTGRQNLAYAADLAGARDERRLDWTVARSGLGSRADEPVRTYGRAMRARLAVARALVTGPELVVLDEATRGLDVEGSREMLALLKKLARDAEVAVLFATRNLNEAMECASRLIVLDGGRVAHDGPTVQIQAAGFELVFTLDHAAAAAEDLVRVRGLSAELASEETVRLGSHVDEAEIVSWLSARGYRVRGLERRHMTLEELLVRLASGPLPPPPAVAPRPEEVKDVLTLLDDTDADLSAFLRGREEGEGA
jgi:ABC-2 type transport system ATP-binding protein